MKVLTPLGEYPLEAVALRRRGREVVISARVAGLRSGLVIGAGDLRTASRRAAPLLGAVAGAICLRRHLRD